MGAVPYGLASSLDLLDLLVITIASTLTVYLIGTALLRALYTKYLIKWEPFTKVVSNTRSIGEPYIKKYGSVGLFILTATPIAGVYTGTLLSWLLNIPSYKALSPIILGGLTSCLCIIAWCYPLFKGVSII